MKRLRNAFIAIAIFTILSIIKSNINPNIYWYIKFPFLIATGLFIFLAFVPNAIQDVKNDWKELQAEK